MENTEYGRPDMEEKRQYDIARNMTMYSAFPEAGTDLQKLFERNGLEESLE